MAHTSPTLEVAEHAILRNDVSSYKWVMFSYLGNCSAEVQKQPAELIQSGSRPA